MANGVINHLSVRVTPSSYICDLASLNDANRMIIVLTPAAVYSSGSPVGSIRLDLTSSSFKLQRFDEAQNDWVTLKSV